MSAGPLRNRLEAVIAQCSLGTVAHKPIGKLSKGYRQRVSMAQALLHDPEVLIMDEPTSGLDPNQIRGVRQLIRELGQSKTVLVSTHILQEVEPVADRVLFIHDGKIVFDGKPAELPPRGGIAGRPVLPLDGTTGLTERVCPDCRKMGRVASRQEPMDHFAEGRGFGSSSLAEPVAPIRFTTSRIRSTVRTLRHSRTETVTTLQDPTDQPRRRVDHPGPAIPGRSALHVIQAIFKRNFSSYFSNPAGYVFITIFVFICACWRFGSRSSSPTTSRTSTTLNRLDALPAARSSSPRSR